MPRIVNEPCETTPTTGTLAGDTTFVAPSGTERGHLRLGTATNFSRGQFYYVSNLAQNFQMVCDFWAGGGTGSDANGFFWGGSALANQEDDAVAQYGVVANENADQVQIRFNGSNISTVAFANWDNSTWRQIHVICQGQHIRVRVNGLQVLDFTDDTVRSLGGDFFGWHGRSGGTNNEHRVSNMQLWTPTGNALNINKLRPAIFAPGNAR